MPISDLPISKPHDYEDEVDPLTDDGASTARLDLLSAYTMHGRLERDGLLPSSVTATGEEAVPVVEPRACADEGYHYKAPSENTWRAASNAR